MKILHVVSSLQVGGAERFVIDLATAQQSEHQCQIGILSMGNEADPLVSTVSSSGFELFHAVGLKSLRQIFKQFDIIHIHTSHALLRSLIACIGLNKTLIYTRHNELVHSTLKWRMTYTLAKQMLHRMIFVSDNARDKYLKTYPSFELQTCTILNGVLPMSNIKSESNRFRLSHVGRFVPLKAQHVLIEAVAKLPKSLQDKVSINFYGTGDLMSHNQQLADELIPGIPCHFHGFVTNREVIYQATDALVVTSETEGLSLAILEALASSTPVIASHVGGNPELVHDGENGLLYPFSDSEKLAEQIENLMTDQSQYKRFASKSLTLYQNGFSMSSCAAKYIQQYQ
ncbi:glycosyltransferase family 4 protein [Thalassotalea sp. LPB0316]|uniref:glycosyltransferase family 4 protein n=1 Tax=Thalassotalea sp. LPB0316 TaxID=2769490 RepID=UPI0018687D97|nr:glycosyltransferase family 4 protein [Thalassotalea sp. LPB0316]QOL26497.1 glycosyltransferase family 4 protein [Thalassotalea sp. LPB0316]